MVGHLPQPEVGPQLGEVGQGRNDAAVVGLEEGLEGQDGEELVLGEVLAAADGRATRKASWATARGDLVIGVRVFM